MASQRAQVRNDGENRSGEDAARVDRHWRDGLEHGRAICSRPAFPLPSFNRTKSKADPLLAQGAKWADTPKAVAAASDVVFAIVGFPSDVREVLLGSDGALTGSKGGNVLVDMTTSEPSLAVEIAEAAKAKGGFQRRCSGVRRRRRCEKRHAVDHGRAGIKTSWKRLAPCFQAMGKTIVYQGGPGSGQHTKMVNQMLIATNMIGVCEALLYGYKAGLICPRSCSRWAAERPEAGLSIIWARGS